MESTPKSNPDIAQAQEQWYNNDIGNEPIKIDMSQQQPLHQPHDHEFILDPSDADSDWAQVYKCTQCDHGVLMTK